ncbi:hypothetical protein [Oligoflexus tunisiensis]|uniref:hypothetical protein n=1 Tax=Oligoflexus tunisiensis TaxID=708132 RepID=UPI00114CCBDD|nr:hypothetical protein [Oligoflexus tunisiensis]
MRKMGLITVLWGILASSLAQGSTHATRWTLRNEAQAPMTLSCRNISVSALDIVLPEQTLAPGAQIIHDWGDRYYNDGLWLNPGKWSCSVKAVSPRLVSERTATFSTDWGEAITVVLNLVDNQVRLKKIPVKPPLAKGKSKDK